MVSGLKNFRGAEDINKSQVVISSHAIERFTQHCRERRQLAPANYREAEMMIHEYLSQASHEKAIGPVERVRALIDYKEETFYFRLGHWQFRVARSQKYRNIFVLVTIVWLNEKHYLACLK